MRLNHQRRRKFILAALLLVAALLGNLTISTPQAALRTQDQAAMTQDQAAAPQPTVGGEVIGWGENTDGQVDIPRAARSGVTAIAAGRQHSLALG